MHPSPDQTPSPTGGADHRRAVGRRADAVPAGRSAGEQRRPYPTAPTTTRPSYARPGPPRRPRTVRTPPPPIPSTVWICRPDTRGVARPPGLELWAREVLAAILAAFTAPLDRVGVLPWPDPTGHPVDGSRRLTPPRPAAGGVALDRLGPSSALDVISAEGRLPILVDLRPGPAPAAATHPLGRGDAGARTVELSGVPAELMSPRPPVARIGDHPPSEPEPPHRLDLIITGAEPGHVDPVTAQHVALVAARCLRLGGTLIALTHCDHTHGQLVDPGGLLVTAAQDADLLYFQHIVAVTTLPPDRQQAPNQRPEDCDSPTAPSPGMAGGMGWRPQRHPRVHCDLYVFGQPHDHAADDHPDPGHQGLPLGVSAGPGATGVPR